MKSIATFILVIIGMTFTQAQREKKIKGDGNIVSLERKIGDFGGIAVGSFYQVALVDGEESTVTLKGEANLLEYIETEVKSGTLIIKAKKNVQLRPSRGETIYVTIPVDKIDAIRLSGSGKVVGKKTFEASNFKIHTSGSKNADLRVNAKNVIIITSGSSNITLGGTSESLEITSSGSSNLSAYEFTTDTAEISSSGSSNIRITVNESIDSRSSGSSNTKYRGNPDVIHSKSSGSSRVSKQ